MICDPWDVVVVPFPFTEKAGAKRRPALVLSPRPFNENGHTLLAMITTQSHSPWPGDTNIKELSTKEVLEISFFTFPLQAGQRVSGESGGLALISILLKNPLFMKIWEVKND